jgi:hypothetical protein
MTTAGIQVTHFASARGATIAGVGLHRPMHCIGVPGSPIQPLQGPARAA